MRPARAKKILSQPQRLTSEKAYLLGFWAGDGNVQIESDGTTKVSANCGSETEDEQLACFIAESVKKLYGVPCKVRLQTRKLPRRPCWQPITYRKAVAEDLLSYGPLGTYDWLVPNQVKAGTNEVKAAWLAGFFDAEGHVVHKPKKGKREAVVTSVNEQGLREARELLTDLGIGTSFTSHDRRHEVHNQSVEHKIHVCNRAALGRFAKLVELRCERKNKVLQEALGTYKRHQLLNKDVEELVPQILELREQGLFYKDIAAKLGLTYEQARGAVKRRRLTKGRHGSPRKEVEKSIPEILCRQRLGHSYERIARDMDLTKAQVFQRLKKRGHAGLNAKHKPDQRGERWGWNNGNEKPWLIPAEVVFESRGAIFATP